MKNNFHFYDNWRDILKRAWSLRFMALAAVLSAAEVALPLFQDAIPHGVFAVLSMVAVAGAFVARLVAQKDI
jgi:hypothetical protein